MRLKKAMACSFERVGDRRFGLGRRRPRRSRRRALSPAERAVSAIGDRGHQQRPEHERQERKQHRHGYTSIFTICLIQMKPIACITMQARIIIWPMRSSKSRVHMLRD
jgi:hypothetical protein